MKEKCLAQMLGSCQGCDIYTMASKRAGNGIEDPNAIRTKIGKSYCPEGMTMQPINLPKASSIW